MPPRHTVLLTACAVALALAFGHGARAQDDDGDDDETAAPVVVDINGPCMLTVKGQATPCRGVAYMVFPSNHRIDFTAITETAGWAFSGEDDENQDGRYALELDSVLNPGSGGRAEAQGRCEMQVAEDRRTVKSLDCRAMTEDGEMRLEASGTIAVEDEDDDSDGPSDDGGS
ncbi:MAG TPA: hypothetical protein VGM25_14115 [Caulobacteraceae bacterium]|jgi:hypothetical protein